MSDNEQFDFTEDFSLDDIIAEHYITNIEEQVASKVRPSEKTDAEKSNPFVIPEIDNIESVLPSNFDDALKDMQTFFRTRDKAAENIFDDYPALGMDLNIREQEEEPPVPDIDFSLEKEAEVEESEPEEEPEKEPEPEPAQEEIEYHEPEQFFDIPDNAREPEGAKQKELAELAFFSDEGLSDETINETEAVFEQPETRDTIDLFENDEPEVTAPVFIPEEDLEEDIPEEISEEPEEAIDEPVETVEFKEPVAEVSFIKEEVPEPEPEDESQTEILLFDDFRRRQLEESADAYDEPSGMQISEEKRGLFKKFIKNKESTQKPVEITEEPEPEPEPIPEPEEEYIPEPDYSEAANEIISKISGKIIRSRICVVIGLVMFVLVILFERGVKLPFIGEAKIFMIVITALQVITAGLAYDVMLRGITDIANKTPGAHTVVLFSNIVTLVSNILMLLGIVEMSYTFSAVSALSAAFALFGDYRKDTAKLMALKTATAVASPYSVTCCYVEEADAKMIMKHKAGTEGFYNDLNKRDFAEKLYTFFCPFLIVAAVLLAFVASITSKKNYIICLSSLAASAAAFTAFSAYALPFLKIIRALRKSGSTIAGWGGADEIYTSHGVRITDEDIFPSGTVVESARAYEGFRLEKVVRYAASIMIAADNGLSKAFSDLLDSQSLAMARVEEFKLCQEGIMAIIKGERVLCGTNACMTLYGIKAPQELNSKNTIYIAINGMPAGAITISYKPLEAVQSSLLAMIRSKFTLFFAVRDFNVSPLMVKQRLQVPIDDIECFPVDDIYKISSMNAAEVPHTSAILARFNPKLYADTINAALSLRKVTVVNTIISLITTIAGILLAFFMCLKGASGAASPTSIAEYMLAMQIITIVISSAASAG